MKISLLKKNFLSRNYEEGYGIKALAVTMISMIGVSIGLGAFVMLVNARFDDAVKAVEHSALDSYAQNTQQVLSDPALTLQYRQDLLKVKLLPKTLKEQVHLLGPDDLALKDAPKLVRVKGQKKRLSENVSRLRFVSVKQDAALR